MLDPNEIRQARYTLSLSQHELARRACVSRTALNQFEQGSYQAGPNFCRKLRDYFETKGIHLEELREPPPEGQPTAVGPRRPLVPDEAQAQAQAHATGERDSEDAERAMPGPIEILVGVGLSLILGRRVGL